MSETSTFDPSRYLTKVGAADYLEVKWRLVWLREVHPDAHLDTELVSHSDQAAIFKATISIPGGGSSTGFGSETYNDFRDYLEKAETKAVGRALSALGFGTQFSAYEFGGEADNGRIVDSPVNLPPRARTNGQNVVPQAEPMITPKQIAMIQKLKADKGLTDAGIKQLHGKASAKELTIREASSLITELLSYPDSQPDIKAENAEAEYQASLVASGDPGARFR